MEFGQWLDLLARFLGIVVAVFNLLRGTKNKRRKPRKSRKRAKRNNPTAPGK